MVVTGQQPVTRGLEVFEAPILSVKENVVVQPTVVERQSPIMTTNLAYGAGVEYVGAGGMVTQAIGAPTTMTGAVEYVDAGGVVTQVMGAPTMYTDAYGGGGMVTEMLAAPTMVTTGLEAPMYATTGGMVTEVLAAPTYATTGQEIVYTEAPGVVTYG
mmetsp:Transcript_4196/g.7410  ORF Transcript_4196/g.7410 Transcript_4196/m.7410 type:complete len:158 (+) Transcript_4196:2-475(+)